MSLRWWLYLCAVVIVPWAYVLGRRWIWAPIQIWRKHVMKGGHEWEPTTADHLSPEMTTFVGQAVERFRQVGFEVVFNARRPGAATNVLDAHQLLLINRTTNDTATAIIVRTKRTRSMVLGILSTFRDGQRISTQSRQQVGFMPRDPLMDRANFPQISDPALLWEAHQKRLEIARRSAEQRIAPPVGEEEAYLNSLQERERARMVECGYFRRMPSGDYRPTWKGAFLMTWKLTEPLKRWRVRRQVRKADRLWSALGMEGAVPLTDAGTPSGIVDAESSNGMQIEPGRPAQLPYDAVLAPGEIRESWEGATLTVRIGLPSVGQVLARRWVSMLYLVFVVLMLGWTVYRMWVWWQLAQLIPAVFRYVPRLSPFLIFWLLLLVWEAYRLRRALSQARGTVILVASEAGLRFNNAIDTPHSGFIPRREFHSFRVAMEMVGFSKRTFRIDARFNNGRRPLALAVTSDLPAIRSALRSIAAAIGLSSAPEVVEPLPD